MSAEGDEQVQRRAGNAFWLYASLGSVFSAFAIVSLAQKVFEVGLKPVLAEIVSYYRDLVHPPLQELVAALHSIVPEIAIPDGAADLYAISFVGGATMARSLWILPSRANSAYRPLMTIMMGTFLGASLAGLAAIAAWLVFLAAAPFVFKRDSVYNNAAFAVVMLFAAIYMSVACAVCLASSHWLRPMSFVSAAAAMALVPVLVYQARRISADQSAISAYTRAALMFALMLPLSLIAAFSFFAINSQI